MILWVVSSTESGELEIGILKRIIKQFSNRQKKQILKCLFSRKHYNNISKEFHTKEKYTYANKKLDEAWKNYNWKEIEWNLDYIKKFQYEIKFWIQMLFNNGFKNYITITQDVMNNIIFIKFNTITDINIYKNFIANK